MTPTEHIQGMLEQPHMKATLDHLISTNAVYAQAYARLTPFEQVGDVAMKAIRAIEPGRLTKIAHDAEQATYRIRTCQSHDVINIVDNLVADCQDLIGEVERLTAHRDQLLEGLGTYRRTVREAIEELFGPTASLESEEATLLRGPEPQHDAVIEALQRVSTRLTKAQTLALAVGRWLDNTDTGSQLNKAYQEYLKPTVYEKPIAGEHQEVLDAIEACNTGEET